MSSNHNIGAEQGFREAFERLKQNKPRILPRGCLVTQNNVAKEAGRDPSALRKTRYPLLILEIQSFISLRNEINKSATKKKNNRHRKLQEKLKDYQNQVNHLCSIVSAQNTVIKELKLEINFLTIRKLAPDKKSDSFNP